MKTIVVWPKIISHTTIVFKNWSVLAINLLPFRKCCLTIYNNKRYRIHITNGTVCSSISLFFSFVRLFQSYISYGSFITQLCGIFYFCYKILFLMFSQPLFPPMLLKFLSYFMCLSEREFVFTSFNFAGTSSGWLKIRTVMILNSIHYMLYHLPNQQLKPLKLKILIKTVTLEG